VCDVSQPFKLKARRNNSYIGFSRRPLLRKEQAVLILCKPSLAFPEQYMVVKSGRRFLSSKQSVFDNVLYRYDDPVNQREQVRKDNKDKAGIYGWVNKINNKIYIGSGSSLYKRISDYYQP